MTTSAATGVGTTTATLKGTVDSQGNATTYRFQYGISTFYGSSIPVPEGDAGSGVGAIARSASPTGLSPNTTYHYRITATNSKGTTNGADQTFKTVAMPPTVTLTGASSVKGTSATFKGSVDGRGFESFYRFEYLTEADYEANGNSFEGANAPTKVPSPDLGIGTGTANVRQTVTDLEPETDYRLRLRASSAQGASTTAVQSFSTESGSAASVDSDVNGDGRADLVTLRPTGVAYVHPGGTDMKFGIAVTSFSGSPLNVAQYDGTGHYVIDVADVDGDLDSDLVTLSDDGDAHVYRGGSESTLAAAVNSDLNLNPGLLKPGGHEPIAVADVDGDTQADLVSYDDVSNEVMVYLGKSDATFEAGVAAQSNIVSALHAGSGHYFLDVEDVTGDTRADLVSMTSTDDLSVLAGQGNGTFAAPVVSHKDQIDAAMDDGSGYEPFGIADSTGDGYADLVLLDNTDGEVLLHPGAANGSFGTAVKAWPLSVPTTTFTTELANRNQFFGLMDVNGDGRGDLTGTKENFVYAIKGQTNGTFSEAGVSLAGAAATTQHNQTGSTKNEVATEKPSWKRRGCAKGWCDPEPLFTFYDFESETELDPCPVVEEAENEVSGGCVAEDLEGTIELGMGEPWATLGLFDVEFDLVIDPNGDGYAVNPTVIPNKSSVSREACDEADNTPLPWPVNTLSPTTSSEDLKMEISIGMKPDTWPAGTCGGVQTITVEATQLGYGWGTELEQIGSSANLKDGYWLSSEWLGLEWD